MYTAGEQRYAFNNFLHRSITADKRECVIISCIELKLPTRENTSFSLAAEQLLGILPQRGGGGGTPGDSWWGGGGGPPGNSWWGVCRPVPQILTRFQINFEFAYFSFFSY